MSSRFFRGGNDSSSDSSSDEEELTSEEELEEQKKGAQDDSDEESDEESEEEESDEESSDDEGGPKGAMKFLKDESESESEDSDEEKPGIVKSAKDKRLEELDACIKQIENGQKNGDWSLISAEFDKLNRQVTRLQEGKRAPRQYIRTLAELEDFMNEALAKAKVTPKKMNGTLCTADTRPDLHLLSLC
jgi:translation initiation factor 3 subunit C